MTDDEKRVWLEITQSFKDKLELFGQLEEELKRDLAQRQDETVDDQPE